MRALATTAATLALLAGAGCASTAPYEELTELVQLRGTALTMLERHEISVDEARMVKVMLDTARRASDAGRQSMAQSELDAVRAYLKSRQGQAL